MSLRTLKQFLADRGLPALEERYAILAYGSNACPGQLLRKYQDHGLTNVPVLFGRLVGAEAVYAHRETIGGHYVPSTLARKEGTRPSWITLLTRIQLKQMDASEGRPDSYELGELIDTQFSIGKKLVNPLYTYVNVLNGVMIREGKPVSLRSARQKRAKLLVAETAEDTSAEDTSEHWLNYNVIADPEPPENFSRIVKQQ